MRINRVSDESFSTYGQVIDDPSFEELCKELKERPMPSDSVVYVPSDERLEALNGGKAMSQLAFGELPVEVGYCNGNNSKLNALEYHRSSEINFAATDCILLLGRLQDVTAELTYDTSKVEAFLIPQGTVINLFATSLHYAPCTAPGNKGFRVGVVLPRETNLPLRQDHAASGEDSHLTAINKWLLGHPEGGLPEGSPMGLIGKNIDLSQEILTES